MLHFTTATVLFIFSLTALCLQLSSIKGCDFIRIHFKALNGNGIYFNDNPYVGLGLFEHQTFTGKNTRDWQFDETCQAYNTIETEMFLDGNNMDSIKVLAVSSLVLHGIVVLALATFLIALLVRGFFVVDKNRVTMPIFCIVIGMLTSASLALQVVALDKIHEENGICDRDTYFPTGWNENFPFQIYPEYAYFKYFHECKMGPDGKRAKESIAIGGFVTFLALMSAIVMLLLRNSSAAGQIANVDESKNNLMQKFPLRDMTKKNAEQQLGQRSSNDHEDDDATDIDDDEESFFENNTSVWIFLQCDLCVLVL